MQLTIKQLFLLLFSSILFFTANVSDAQSSDADSSLLQLKSAIAKALEATNTPAAGIALVDTNGPLWIAGLGKANVEKDIPADENTMFRIGSVSKMFVALAMLKLQQEGKLSLDDKIRDLIPEIEFENPWEATDPVRIVHLLEHTTGWEDLHQVEFSHNDPSPIGLKEGLDFHPHSRTSRWVPGTRNAYCNAGSAVAAYIVEKISGMRYEDYIKEKFLVPLKMENTTFFHDEKYKRLGAELYNANNEPFDYWHFIYRPAGAANASARDMAKFVQFFIHRGAIDTLQWIDKTSIERMETPKSTPGAQAGLELGFGLGNFTSIHKGFVYHGHEGAIHGGLTELAYLPEYGIGHVFFINASNGKAFSEISRLIRDFETQHLNRSVHKNVPVNEVEFESGYYVSINPRIQGAFFFRSLIRYLQDRTH